MDFVGRDLGRAEVQPYDLTYPYFMGGWFNHTFVSHHNWVVTLT